MRKIDQKNTFKKDYKRELHGKYRNVLLSELSNLIQKLAEDKTLEDRLCDHALIGKWKGYRDCHIRPDLILIYKKTPGIIILTRLGSHSELF